MAARAYPSYMLDLWSAGDGLPQHSVNAIAQTRDGYLWLATAGGLVRFDGTTFHTFTSANTPGLRDIRILSLLEDRDGTLWIGTEHAGLFMLRDGVLSAPPWQASLPGLLVRALHESRDGALWIATDRGLARVAQGRVTTYNKASTNGYRSPGGVLSIAESADGTLWASLFKQGVVRIEGSTLREVPSRDPREAVGDVGVLAVDAAGTLWAGAEGGLHRLENGQLVRVPLPGARASAPLDVLTLLPDPSGGLWAGTREGLWHVEANGAIRAEAGLDAIDIRAMRGDREGSLWIGTATHGLYRLRPRRVTALIPETLQRLSLVPIVGDGGDGVWLGATCGGLWHLRGRTFEHYGVAQRLPYQCIWALHRDPDGTLWAGMLGGGLMRLQGDRYTMFSSAQGLSSRDVSAIVRDRDGVLWVGTNGAIDRLTPAGTFVSARLPIQPASIWFITERQAGGLWVGTTAGLYRFEHDTFTPWSSDAAVSRIAARAVREDADGTLWVGTYGAGLYRLKDGRLTHYTRVNGLFDDVVSRIVDDGRGRLWMTGLRGIFSVPRQELDDVAEGRARSVSCVWYDATDGMVSPETNGGGQWAGWQGEDGRLWIPTVAGVALIDPAAPHNAAPPLPLITQVFVDQVDQVEQVDQQIAGRDAGIARELVIPAGARSVRIEYAALSFIQPQKVQYRYRLDGYDAGWIDAGTRASVDYTGLPPGQYRFEVRARNADGVWSSASAGLPVRQLPYFYQTTWFAALAIAGIFAGGVATQRARLRSVSRRAQALEATVSARTQEVHAQRDRLAAAHDQLSATHEQLTHAHGDLLIVLNHLRLGFSVINPSGMVTFVSETGQRLAGRTPAETVGRPWQQLLPLSDEDRARLEAMIARPVSERTRLLVRLEPVAGHQYWTQIDVRDDPRDPARRFLYFYDVTEIYRGRRILDGPARFRDLVGDSAAMRLVYRQIAEVAALDVTVVIQGETGTGKELVARAIHDLSARQARTFLAVNCAGLTESVLASQLFGHRRGAFTGAVSDQVGLFEAANRGTLFLDEIGDMPLAVQATLLRVLQEWEITRLGDSRPRKIDVRVLTATHRDLQAEVAAGRFRADLFYRLGGTRVDLPPLRDRREDIPLLVDAFLEQARLAGRTAVHEVSREAMERLMAHAWPGNVRELRAAIEFASAHASTPFITPADLPPELLAALASSRATKADESLNARDPQHILAALARTHGNRAEAARLLGVGRATLYRRLRDLGIDTSATD